MLWPLGVTALIFVTTLGVAVAPVYRVLALRTQAEGAARRADPSTVRFLMRRMSHTWRLYYQYALPVVFIGVALLFANAVAVLAARPR